WGNGQIQQGNNNGSGGGRNINNDDGDDNHDVDLTPERTYGPGARTPHTLPKPKINNSGKSSGGNSGSNGSSNGVVGTAPGNLTSVEIDNSVPDPVFSFPDPADPS